MGEAKLDDELIYDAVNTRPAGNDNTPSAEYLYFNRANGVVHELPNQEPRSSC